MNQDNPRQQVLCQAISCWDATRLKGCEGRGAGSYDGTVFVWELARNTVVGTLTGGGTTPVLGCSWSPQVRRPPPPLALTRHYASH